MILPRNILQHWEFHHGQLNDVMASRFFQREEVLKLAILPPEHVLAAIRAKKKLNEILVLALSTAQADSTLSENEQRNVESAIDSDALYCKHRIRSFDRCGECRPIRPHLREKLVWLAAKGGKFHYDRYCEYAAAAQEEFRLKGGLPQHWYSASENAVRWDREPCNWCVKKHPLDFEWFTPNPT